MSIQHLNIPDAQIHESKGVATAANKATYVSLGTGTGVWRLCAQGSCYFEGIATPYVLTYPAVYAKLAPTTTAGGTGVNVTEGTNARVTYIGTSTLTFNVHATVSISQSVGANRDIRLAVYKNGIKVNGSVIISTTASSVKQVFAIAVDVSMATNDYIELYAQNDGASGDINVHTFNLMLDPQDN